MDDTFSPHAQICQQIKAFDFPRDRLPECFHYVGPIASDNGENVSFPWNELNGRPLIYASLGTLLNRRHMLHQIAEACESLPVQLVLTLGGGGKSEEYGNLPGKPIVVPYAPQREVLKRAKLTITTAGLNTTLESLREGVPLVAIPMTSEQPAVAARIRWTGTGDFLIQRQLTAVKLREMVVRVLEERRYRDAAERIKACIERTRGREHAAEIIERLSGHSGQGTKAATG